LPPFRKENLPMTDPDILIDEAAFCALTALKPSTARKLRCFGGGPFFVKLGRSVRYRRADVLAWIEARRVRSTSQAA
jgi:predicted DNA-binding transcriptional regulator AlpA